MRLGYLMLGICLVSCLLETFSWSGRWQLILGQRGRDSRVLATKLERAKELLQSRKPFGKPPDPEDLEKQYAELHEAIAEFELERGIVGLPRVGDMVRGHVVDFDEIGALVDIGAKTNAHLPVSEMSLQPTVNVSSIVQLGQTITCKVVGMWQRYIPIVSLKSAAIKSTWKQINHLRDMDEAFEVVVKEAFKSGAICDAFGLQAFLPSSHSLSELNADLKGTRIMVKVVEANENDGKIIISQKRCFQNQDDIKLGQVINATVLAIREYGVFVELESKQQGLLHISQITNVRLDKPLDQIFTVGDVIKVMVQDYEKRSGKVAVSTKVFEEHPGDMLVNATHVYAYAERNAVQHLERLEILKRELNPSA